MNPIFDVVRGLISPVTNLVHGWHDRKKAKLEGEIRLNQAAVEAKINRLQTGQQADIAWENLSIQNSGWKDEYILILLSIPLVMCFIPGMDVYVYRGFASLEKTPHWYRWAFMVVVGSSYGYRKIADFMSLKKGDK
jgi:hypothetical protein